jgi:hypothetical protein
MSSAILYLAIVAIWACVLIPRWLRRDSARGAAAAQAPAQAPGQPSAPSAPSVDAGLADQADLVPGDSEDVADDVPRQEPAAPAAGPASGAEARRRMLAARRRLLLMLTGLEIAAVTLAVVGLAAVWVVIPPSIMLSGYLLLLREAGRADAERTRNEAEAAAHTRARLLEARRATPAEGMPAAGVAAAAAALAARFAAAPVAADYQDSGPGRDFAPGLAGKYTTSNADADAADEDYYDAYEPPRLRAVGD